MVIDNFERRLLGAHWAPTSFVSIPETILGIMKAEPDQVEQWCDRLERCLLPQASLADDTPLAIPFLKELLERRVALQCIYRTLVYIVVCTEELGSSSQLGTECRKQVRAGLDIYLRHAAELELPIDQRSDAIDVICRLTEDREKWEPVLRGIYDAEPNADLRTEILGWLNDDL